MKIAVCTSITNEKDFLKLWEDMSEHVGLIMLRKDVKKDKKLFLGRGNKKILKIIKNK